MFVAAGVAVMAACALLMLVSRSMRRWPALWVGLLIAGFVAAASLIVGQSWDASARRVLEGGDFKVVEGEVRNFKPMPYGGRVYESFEVSGVPFRYSDYEVSAGFNNAASHGGPIREGLRVRIAYVGNTILRLEVAADQAPTPKERLDHSNRERAESLRAIDHSAPVLGGFAGMAVVMLLWTVGWRQYVRALSSDRASLFWQIAFRLIAFVGLCQSAWKLAEEALHTPRAGHDYWIDALVFAIIVGFFLAADAHLRWRYRRDVS